MAAIGLRGSMDRMGVSINQGPQNKPSIVRRALIMWTPTKSQKGPIIFGNSLEVSITFLRRPLPSGSMLHWLSIKGFYSLQLRLPLLAPTTRVHISLL